MKTYDIVNAGPRNRFMANGKIVSNSSRGFQTQNLTRGGTVPNILDAIPDIIEGASLEDIKLFYGPPIIVASELVRPTFIAPPDKWLARGDYSQVEDRINNWYGGQEDQLDVFRK